MLTWNRRFAFGSIAIFTFIVLGRYAIPGFLFSHYKVLQGNSMGTTYKVILKVTSSEIGDINDLIVSNFQTIDKQMSTYREDSEIFWLNHAPQEQWLPISSDMFSVLNVSMQYSHVTHGIFDVTVHHTVTRWGFDHRVIEALPNEAEIKKLSVTIGHENLVLQHDPPALYKKNTNTAINLSAVAKGYAVDRLAHIFLQRGIENFYIQLGGEIRVQGVNSKNKTWGIGIEDPRSVNKDLSILGSVNLNNASISTSGTYRNFFKKDGQNYSHLIDPATTAPTTSLMTSVSVVHTKAVVADILSTAMMIMGRDKAIRFAHAQKIAAVLVTVCEKDIDIYLTDAMHGLFFPSGSLSNSKFTYSGCY